MNRQKEINKVLLGLILFVLASPVFSKMDRIALIIGNTDYKEAPLRNPTNDAQDMASNLRNKGFEVTQLLNANQRQMETAIREFNQRLKKDSVGLFYFAGHGLEMDGENYLIPVGALIEHEFDVRYEAVGVGRLLDGMQRASNGLNIVILDACRNNPYSRKFRNTSRGLAEMRPASGTLILYATEPGNVASDGEGRNGLFTEQLMHNLNKPGLKVEDVFKETAISVHQITGGKQVPWYEGVILGQFYFYLTSSDDSRPQSPPSTNESILTKKDQAELIFWQSVEKNPSPESYNAYLKQWPNGSFASLAHLQLQNIDKKYVQHNTNIQANEMTKAEIQQAFLGKTVFGRHHKKQIDTERYFDPDGKLYMLVIDLDKKVEGRWSAKNGQLCQKLKDLPIKCRKVVKHGDIIKLYSPAGDLGMTFENFRSGNQL